MAKPRLFDDLLDTSADLSDLLPPELPKEVLSSPEVVTVHWLRQICACGREYHSEEYGPTIRHTLSRRMGFGLREVGKVHIPVVPGMDLSEIPVETRITTKRIFFCPDCIGRRASLPLFPEQPVAFLVKKNGDAMSPHVAAWHEMHKASLNVHETLVDMKKRQVDFDDLLVFRTTKIDLSSQFRDTSTVDPEE